MFSFLHAADIHLDSPLKNIAGRDGAPVEIIRAAARRALENLVRLAMDEKVDFLLLAGDLYDGTWKDYNTGLFFIQQMRRLREAGIRVFLVSGNHDAASKITRALRLPENVVHFPSRRPATEIIEELGVAVHGQSYGKSAVTTNLALQYPPPESGLFNIGLLHTALSGRPGHEPYAPCSRDDLIHKGYDYWALGHVHQREEVCRDPWIIFCGNLQGRHIRETGPKGALLVRVENGRAREPVFHALDVVRWARCTVDCAGFETEAELLDAVGTVFERELDQADDRPLMLCLELTGATPLHGDLIRDPDYLRSNLQALAIDCGDLWLEKLVLHTTRPQEPAAVLEGTPLEGLLQREAETGDELFEARLIQTLARRLPPELSREEPLVPEDEAGRGQLLAEVRDMVLARILDGMEQ